jgi:transcription elongation factor Elf1
MESYSRLYTERSQPSGYGLEVKQHFACPFCAHPDFWVAPLMDVPSVLTQEATCEHCGRSAKTLFENVMGGQHFELVQTGGDDPPEWLVPAPKRI